METEATPVANPVAERPTPATFRQRAVERLQAERAADVPPSPAESPNEDVPTAPVVEPAGQVAEPEVPEIEETESPETADLAPEAGQVEETAEATEETAEPAEGSVEFYQQRAEEAEVARANMERDYRLKTTEIAETRRNVEELAQVAQAENEFYVGQADRAINERFGNVNWDALKADPAEYQKAANAYRQAMQVRDAALQRRNTLQETFQKKLEETKQQQADLSRKMLKTVIGERWNNDHVMKLREFAESEGLYTSQAFNDIVDWQRMYLLDHLMTTKAATKKLQPPRKRKGSRPSVTPQAQPQKRNAKGQFESARDALRANPGDRQAAREFFRARLAADRGGR